MLLGAVNNLKLVGSNKGFNVYFNANDQTYTVFKDGKFELPFWKWPSLANAILEFLNSI